MIPEEFHALRLYIWYADFNPSAIFAIKKADGTVSTAATLPTNIGAIGLTLTDDGRVYVCEALLLPSAHFEVASCSAWRSMLPAVR